MSATRSVFSSRQMPSAPLWFGTLTGVISLLLNLSLNCHDMLCLLLYPCFDLLFYHVHSCPVLFSHVSIIFSWHAHYNLFLFHFVFSSVWCYPILPCSDYCNIMSFFIPTCCLSLFQILPWSSHITVFYHVVLLCPVLSNLLYSVICDALSYSVKNLKFKITEYN